MKALNTTVIKGSDLVRELLKGNRPLISLIINTVGFEVFSKTYLNQGHLCMFNVAMQRATQEDYEQYHCTAYLVITKGDKHYPPAEGDCELAVTIPRYVVLKALIYDNKEIVYFLINKMGWEQFASAYLKEGKIGQYTVAMTPTSASEYEHSGTTATIEITKA